MYKKITNSLPLKIKSLNNKGKFVWIQLEKNWSIWITLGLTGKLIKSCNSNDECKSHNHVEFITTGGIFYMNDSRNFGTVKFCNSKADLDNKIDGLGPDLIVDVVSKDYLCNKIHSTRTKKNIAQYLLDQSVLSGVGNYVRADSLYLAKISPYRKLKDLTDKDCVRLQQKIQKVLKDSYKQKSKYSKLIIYRQTVSPSGNRVIRGVIMGRGIWWSPSVQT